MAPKKKEQQKMSLGDFMADSGFGGGSWADEVEETYVHGTQPLPPSDRARTGGSSMWQDRGYSVRESSFPTQLPDKPPFTAHLGNLSYDATVETVTEFFEGCDVATVRIIEDRDMQRPKGFGYVEFGNLEGLKKALAYDGESFQGRMIKIKIADPPRGGDSGRGDMLREIGDWTRKGPLSGDPPGRSGGRPPADFGESRGPRDFGEARGPREFGDGRPPRDPTAEGRPAREINWERRGPLSPLPQQESSGPDSRGSSRPPRPAPEGLGPRGESYRGDRRQSPATWGEGRQEGSRPPQRDAPERVERAPSAADMDMQWRERMRPGMGVKSPPESHEGSEAPSSPAPAPAAPVPMGRPKLNLQKRTVSEAATDVAPTGSTDSKASPFGAARPIDTAAREKEIEEKRQQAIQEKREADEKAKEERRLAKEAAAKEAAAKAEAEAEAKETVAGTEGTETTDEKPKDEGEAVQNQNGASTEQKVLIRSRESGEQKDEVASPKSRSTEAGNWRSASGDQRAARGPPSGPRGGRGGRGGRGDGPPRGPRNDDRAPRANGPSGQQAPAAAAGGESEAGGPTEEDGWTTVPNKKGPRGRP